MAQRIVVFNLGKDLLLDDAVRKARQPSRHSKDQLVFDPKTFEVKGQPLLPENYVMSEDDLMKYAKMATKIRN